jgi:hypothetical protein
MSKPENKGPAPHPTPSPAPESGGKKGKGTGGVAGGCLGFGCKHDGKRFGFCDEHFEHFKFGLIKKTGEPVSDYDKKFEHFMNHRKKGSIKVA